LIVVLASLRPWRSWREDRTTGSLSKTNFPLHYTKNNSFHNRVLCARLCGLCEHLRPAHSLYRAATTAPPVFHPLIPDQDPGHPATLGARLGALGEHIVSCQACYVACFLEVRGLSSRVAGAGASSLAGVVSGFAREAARQTRHHISDIIRPFSLDTTLVLRIALIGL